jgi:hypothetical protein
MAASALAMVSNDMEKRYRIGFDPVGRAGQ